MRAELMLPHSAFHGTVKNAAYIFFTRGGVSFAMSHHAVPNPQTEEQTAIRAIISSVSKSWKDLTQTSRNDWAQYAAETNSKAQVNRTALDWFMLCNVNLSILEQTLLTGPPSSTPPSPPKTVTGIDAADENTSRFWIEHGIASGSVGNFKVLVKESAQMKSVAVTPRESMMRLIKGVDAGSSATLLASGVSHPYTFSSIRFPVDNGGRYGISVQIVETATGLASLVSMWEGIKTFT